MPPALPDSRPLTDAQGLGVSHRALSIALAEPYASVPLPEPFRFVVDPHPITNWLTALADALTLAPEFDITYVLTDDAGILEVNREYLQHDYYTDILTFDYSTAPGTPYPMAEIYISLERVLDNANTLQVPADEELRRVMIHGLLHLAGQDDATEEQEAQMRVREDELLRLFPFTTVQPDRYEPENQPSQIVPRGTI